MRTPRRTLVALGGLLAALASCDVTKTENSGLVGIFVHGRVADEADAAVAGARITLGWRTMDSCTTTFPVSDSAPSSDAGGAYGILLLDTISTSLICVKVVATPPAALNLAAESAVVPNVALTTNFWNDSVRIDVILPPQPTAARAARAGAPSPSR